MRVLLLGAGGMLARDVVATAPGSAAIVALSRSELDIRDDAAVARAISTLNPECVVNAAAYTDVDGAETDQETAYAVNATAVGQLGRMCSERRCTLVHFSSDYVFDGTKQGEYSEGDDARPINVYGASKLAGERSVLDTGLGVLIIRTQWLFGVGGSSFIRTMWNRALRNEPTQVVTDQFGRATYTRDLAAATWRIMGRHHGILHYANRGRVSRFTLAQEVFEIAGAMKVLSPTTSMDNPGAPRPANSALSTKVAENVLGEQIPGWRDAVRRFLAELTTAGAESGARAAFDKRAPHQEA